MPTDGKSITKWPNRDEAFLNVVKAIKAALTEMERKANTLPSPREAETKPWKVAVRETRAGPRTSNLRVRKQFTDLDRDRFRHEGFEFISKFFENSMLELVTRNPDLDQRFRRIDSDRFTAAVYRDGRKVCSGSASLGDGLMGADSIAYSMDDSPQRGTMNEVVSVKNDEQSLYFEPLGLQSWASGGKQKLSQQGAAELFWDLFIHPLQ